MTQFLRASIVLMLLNSVACLGGGSSLGDGDSGGDGDGDTSVVGGDGDSGGDGDGDTAGDGDGDTTGDGDGDTAGDGDGDTTGDGDGDGAACSADAECDDGVYCNGAETCDPAEGCVAGVAPVVDDGVGCTVDSCDEDNDTVVHAPDDGSCDNGLYCDGPETCDPVDDCQPGVAPDLDDGVSCTDDSCNEDDDAIVHTVNHGLCDNGQYCDGAETCSALSGCQAGVAPNVDDGVGCTDDSCDEANDVIVNTPNDGNCSNGLFCDGAETCDVVNDCQAGAPPQLDDGLVCTIDACDENTDMVTHTADPNCNRTIIVGGNARQYLTQALTAVGLPYTEEAGWPAPGSADYLIVGWNGSAYNAPDYQPHLDGGGHVMVVGGSNQDEFSPFTNNYIAGTANLSWHQSNDCMSDWNKVGQHRLTDNLPDTYEFTNQQTSYHMMHLLDTQNANVTLLGRTCHQAPNNHVMAVAEYPSGGTFVSVQFILGGFDGGTTNVDFVQPLLSAFAGGCGGWAYDAGNGMGCWYTGELGASCNETCAPHGGFDPVTSQHSGNAVGFHFWPGKADGNNWVAIECSSTDNNTNWGANNSVPDGNYTFGACHLNCSCYQ